MNLTHELSRRQARLAKAVARFNALVLQHGSEKRVVQLLACQTKQEAIDLIMDTTLATYSPLTKRWT